MALMVGYDTSNAAQAAHQAATEGIARDELALRSREQALRAFAAKQRAELEKVRIDAANRLRDQEFALRAGEQAVKLGIKYDPVARSYRPLTEDDPEYNPWKEYQAERMAKRPLTPDQQVGLAYRKTYAQNLADQPFEITKEARKEAATIRTEGRKEGAEIRGEKRDFATWLTKQGELVKTEDVKRKKELDAFEMKAQLKHDLTLDAINLRYDLMEQQDINEEQRKAQREEKGKKLAAFQKAWAQYSTATSRFREAVSARGLAEQRLLKKLEGQGKDIGKYMSEPELKAEFQNMMQPMDEAMVEAGKALKDAKDVYDQQRREFGLKSALEAAGETGLPEAQKFKPGTFEEFASRYSKDIGADVHEVQQVWSSAFNNPKRAEAGYKLFDDPEFKTIWAQLTPAQKTALAKEFKAKGIIAEEARKREAPLVLSESGQVVTESQLQPGDRPAYRP